MAKKKVNPEDMSAEEIEKFNAEQKEKQAKRMRQQERNRSKASVAPERDTKVIRGITGSDRVRVVAVRKVGLEDNQTSDVGEPLDLPRDIARRLQEAGAVKVEI